jgi:hypothetical protein
VGEMTNSNKWTADRIIKLREEMGGRCAIESEYCEGQLEFAHISPTTVSGMGRGRKERLYDILRNKECYTLLCHAHHEQYDANGFDLPERVKKNANSN